MIDGATARDGGAAFVQPAFRVRKPMNGERKERRVAEARMLNVLFLCTGNTARSVLAEGILRKVGAGKFRAFSAGSQPKGVVNPFALRTLAAHGYPTEGFRSKSWSELGGSDALRMDYVITVCDSAAGEACPLWPGQPVTAHWGIEDPAAVEGSDADKARAFEQAFGYLARRIEAFTALPLESLDAGQLAAEMQRIGAMDGATEKAAEGGS
jgi:arsenate reductase